VFVVAGIGNGSVSSLDHDVLILDAIAVVVGMLVEAVVGDVLSDLHAVQTHVSQSDGISVVRDLLAVVEIVDEESPFVDEIHLGGEESVLGSDAGLDLLLEDTVYLELVRVGSHVGIDVVWA